MWNKFLNWRKENKYYIMAFWMPLLTLFVVFMGAKIYPFGDRSFLHIDMYHQYLPMLTDFYRMLKGTGEGSGLLYSWNAGLGSNFIAEYAYYLATPTNWLCLLFKEEHLIEFMSYMVVVKTGACGATFAYYLSKHFDVKNISISLFGMFYALSGYLAAYNWDVMWLDPILLAPLIILGLEKLVNEGRFRLYTIALGLAIFSNYYLCIMVCIYLVLYFLLVLLPGAKQKIGAIVRFGLFSIIAGMMAAVMIIPELMALQLSKFTTTNFPEKAKVYFSIFDILARHLFDVKVETGLDHWPNIFCSVAILVLLPLYVVNKKINQREKIGKMTLAAFMLVSFSSNILTYIWHGLNYPDSLPSRQSFLYIMLVLTMGYEAYLYLREYSESVINAVFASGGIFIVLAQKLVTDDALTGRSYLFSIIFLIFYGVLLYFYRSKPKASSGLVFFALILVIGEMGVNTVLTSVPTVSRDDYVKNYKTYHQLYAEYNELENGKLYRFENVDNRVRNDDSMLHNYLSTSLFSSTSNGLVNAFYQKYGMRSSKVFYCYDGMTPFISGLMSNRYLFMKEMDKANSLVDYVTTKDEVSLYEYKDSLPIGYMVYNDTSNVNGMINDVSTAFELIDGDLEDITDSYDPLQCQNALAYNMGADADMYEAIYNQYNGNCGEFLTEKSGYYVAYCDTKKIATVSATVAGDNKSFKKYKNPYVMDLGYVDADERIMIYDSERKNDIHLTVYRMNEDVYTQTINNLQRATFSVDEFESDNIKGHIDADLDGYMVLSIPYDPGFTVKVDGAPVEVSLFCNMMMAVPVSAGMHQIEVSYFTQGLIPGIIISIVAIALLLLIWYSKFTEGVRKHLNLYV